MTTTTRTVYVRIDGVIEMTSMSRSLVYKLMAQGDFPKPIKLTGRAVAWPERAIIEWLESRPVAA